MAPKKVSKPAPKSRGKESASPDRELSDSSVSSGDTVSSESEVGPDELALRMSDGHQCLITVGEKVDHSICYYWCVEFGNKKVARMLPPRPPRRVHPKQSGARYTRHPPPEAFDSPAQLQAVLELLEAHTEMREEQTLSYDRTYDSAYRHLQPAAAATLASGRVSAPHYSKNVHCESPPPQGGRGRWEDKKSLPWKKTLPRVQGRVPRLPPPRPRGRQPGPA